MSPIDAEARPAEIEEMDCASLCMTTSGESTPSVLNLLLLASEPGVVDISTSITLPILLNRLSVLEDLVNDLVNVLQPLISHR